MATFQRPTRFQEDVVVELIEMQKLGEFSKQLLTKAQQIVLANEDGSFIGETGMGCSETADLAISMAWLTKAPMVQA